MSATKREVLLAICEAPGWQPVQECSSTDRHLTELEREGWITPRSDGWEGTVHALDAYPAFVAQSDIADPTPSVPAPPAASDHVPAERVTALIEGLLHELSLDRVEALVQEATELGSRRYRSEHAHLVALALTQRML